MMRTPDFELPGIQLYHGDCLEILPTLADGMFDVAVTSPPYNTLRPDAAMSGLHAERAAGRNVWMEKQSGYEDDMIEGDYQEWQRSVFAQLRRVAPLVWINHKTRYRDGSGIHPLAIYRDAPLYAEIVWDRGISMALNCKRYAPSHEYFFAFGRPRVWNDRHNARCSVWRIAPREGKEESNDHPCPYPVELVRPIIESSDGGRGVIDPFMGSGTTGVACVMAGSQFVGIEKKRRWFDMACNRIRRAYDEYAMARQFFAAEAKMVQGGIDDHS